jgi:transposase
MTLSDRQVAREARAMTVVDVLKKASEGAIKWVQAAEVLNVTPRHLLRLRQKYLLFGLEGLKDKRSGRRMDKRVPSVVVETICKLKKELYEEYSVKHFHEFLEPKHGLKVSYTWVKTILQARGLVEKEPGRGKYRRKRERRPMRGMLLHIDGSTHEWLAGLPMKDLIVVLDDADGRILFARFFDQEGTLSTMAALEHVLRRYGRFCALYTDRGSHFCRTSNAGEAPDEVQNGQVARALKTLGINHIRARSPQARGRSERAFRTIQGRFPKELRSCGIESYEEANRYLEENFVPRFNERFTVKPAQPESAFTPMAGIDFGLLLTARYVRTVRPDNTVSFEGLILQLPQTHRASLARCEVIVHVYPDRALAVAYDGRPIARFDSLGREVPIQKKLRKVA